MMRPLLVVAAVLAAAATVLADDHIVQSDVTFDFGLIRTFALRDVGVTVNRPELNNSLVTSSVSSTVRMVLTSHSLKEVTTEPDVFVDIVVAGQEFSVGPFGRARAIGDGRGGRRGAGAVGQSVAFVEGVLVIDLVARGSGLLIWRGVYRDSERDSAKFAGKLPSEARKLLEGFPPKRR